MKDAEESGGAQHVPRLPSEVLPRPVKQNVLGSRQISCLKTGNSKWKLVVRAVGWGDPFWIMFLLLPALFPLLQVATDGWQWQVLLPVCSFFTCCCLASLVLLAALLEGMLGICTALQLM